MAYKRYKVDTTQFDFSCALKLLKHGRYVTRIIDLEHQTYYKLERNVFDDEIILKCHYNGDLKPQVERGNIQECDLLSNDWVEVFLWVVDKKEFSLN